SGLDLDAPLASLGLDSLRAMEVWAAVEARLGISLPVELLARRAPSGADLVSGVLEQLAGPPAPPLPAAVADPERRHEPFPLTDIQQAYLAGRGEGLALGGVATHAYVELESGDLDLPPLELGRRRLVERHGMLRAVVLPDGRQRVLAEVPPYRIETLDLRGLAPVEAEARLLDVRDRLSHEVRDAGRWPL